MVSRMPDPGYHTLAEQTQRPCKFIDLNATADSLSYTYECSGAYRSIEQASVKFDSPTHYSADFTFTVYGRRRDECEDGDSGDKDGRREGGRVFGEYGGWVE